MSKTVGIALAVAILALAAAVALPVLTGSGDEVGSYRLMSAGSGSMYRIDTTTGDTWISVDGGDWEWIDEPDEDPTNETTAVRGHPARGARGRAHAVALHRARLVGAR